MRRACTPSAPVGFGAATLCTALAATTMIACGGRHEDGVEGASAASRCSAPAGAKQKDVDRRDSRKVPFRRQPMEAVTVHVENKNLSAALWRQVKRAVQIWSESPCLDPSAVDACPPDANCVTVRAHPRRVLERIEPGAGWRSSDGTFTGRQRSGYRIGGRISLNLDFFDRMSANGRLATIVHELGHAFGLRHGRSPGVMNAVTGNETDPRPDRTDFENLLAIYGQGESR